MDSNQQSAPRRASIIIVTFNGRRYLEANLASVTRELDESCEIVIVDNGSTDGGPDFIRRTFPDVRLEQNQLNAGFAAACNQGAALAQGDFLVFLNQDTLVTPGWLAALLDPLDSDQRIGLTTSKVLLMKDPDCIHLAGQNLHFTGLVFGRGYLEPARAWDQPGPVPAVSGASFAIRRDLWLTLSGFDETFFMYYEDTDLSWRAQLLGYDCYYTPASIVYHDYDPGKSAPSGFYNTVRNRYLMLFKNWRWPTLLLLMPALLIAEFIEWALAIKRRRPGVQAKVRAAWWLVRRVGQIRNGGSAGGRLCHSVSDRQMLRRFTWQLEPRSIIAGRPGYFLIAVLNLFMALVYQISLVLTSLLYL